MGLLDRVRRSPVAWWLAAAVTAASVPLIVVTVDGRAVVAALRSAAAAPLGLGAVLAAYGLAFGLRAVLWRRVLPALPLGQAWAALHVALLGNHLLPLRLGEPLRVVSAVRRAGVPLHAATATTVTLRAGDVAAVAALSAAGAAALVPGFGAAAVGLLVAAGAVVVAGLIWLRRLARSEAVRLPGAAVAAGTVVAWLLEVPVVWAAARLAGIDLDPIQAVLVTAVTIAAQVVAVAPAGLGTYEAAATGALVALGARADVAVAAAVLAHAIKTAYALGAGAVALALPRPGLVGRLRLAPPAVEPGPPPRPGPAQPIVLFLPAHDEAATVASVVQRAPATVRGRQVRVLVVDDGSTDATAEEAARAGAEVVRLPSNRGLGAAVRAGLRAALDHDPAAVAFCDADGEYAPEELDTLVAPILEGQADYVVGSRFAGRIERMHPHRRIGNRVLTAVLRRVARAPITDGQSGYRALSARAAAEADIAHDFNYAQVLTLDLLGKGFRYREVPISYRFRDSGRSFVRPLRYLLAVLPAVYRQLNGPPPAEAESTVD